MQVKSLLRVGFSVLCVAVTTLGLINTYGDDGEVVALAQRAACGSDNCSYTLLSRSHSAFGHEYAFQTQLVQQGKLPTQSATALIACKRELVLLGAWKCAPSSASP
jgi:hypothetical protein